MKGASSIRGDAIRWVRKQLGYSMEAVHESGGPTKSMQSEIETGKETEVSQSLLSKWANILQVPVQFFVSDTPRFHANPELCRGMAADVEHLVASSGLPWATLTTTEQMRRLLQLVAAHSQRTPRIILAYVLGIELATLDAMILGTIPITKQVAEALPVLTRLPEAFFRDGQMTDPYQPAIDLAKQLGITPEEACDLVRGRNPPPPTARNSRQG